MGAPHLGTPAPPGFRRFTREYEKQRNDNTYLSGSKETARFEFPSGSEGRGAEFDELVWLILKLKETITHQTSIIEKQNSTIENIRADLAGIKEEQQNLTRQNAELQEQVGTLQSQINVYATSPPSTRSWASVAANRSGTR